MRAKFIYEKFTEESDPVRDMGIGAKFVYYRIYKHSTDDSYNMFLYGSTYDARDILKRYSFKWDDINYVWRSRFPLSMEKWKSFAKEMFDELEKAGYVVQPKGKHTKFELDFKRSFLIPGYEHWEYPYIPDGNNLKVYFKQWHHHAPIIGVTGKGSYIGKDVLKYDGYQFNKSMHMWERTYDEEDVDDLIEYFKSRGYQVIDGRKKERYINERFQEESDPIKDMGIGSHLVYDITPEESEEEYTYKFHTNVDKMTILIKKHIHGISDNEMNRFWAFTLQDIFDEIPERYFENNDLDNIDKYIEQGIASWSRSWMRMHSDKAMKSMMR